MAMTLMSKSSPLLLRPLEKSDLAYFQFWPQNENLLLRGYNYSDLNQEELAFWYAEKTSFFNCYFAIDYTDPFIGFVGAKKLNYFTRSGELGIVLSPKYQSKKLGKEVLEIFLRYFFEEMKMKTLYLYVDQFNQRAISLYKSLSFEIMDEGAEAFENQDIIYEEIYQENKDHFYFLGKTLYSKLWRMRKVGL